MLNDLFFGFGLSILIGALIGAQREIKQQKQNMKDFAGFRTFTFISILGYLLGIFSFEILENEFYIILGMGGIIASSIVAYKAVTKINPEEVSATTEVVYILTFLIGVLVSLKYYYFSITLAILITSILFLGNALHKFAKNLKNYEIFATLKFAIISLIILPILPNKNYNPLDIPFIGEMLEMQNFVSKNILVQLDVFNIYYIWLMVVLISGIAFCGYILMKTIGAEKGIQITGFLGGLMSSTALTSSFSIESKKLNYLSLALVVGTVIACSTMFFRIIFEVAIINPNLLPQTILMLGFMGIVGYACSIYLYKRIKLDHIKKIELKSPFTFGPAIKFAIFFTTIIFFSKLFTIYFGNSGIYIISFFSGFADVDAITITLASLALEGSISNSVAQNGILIAAFANTLFKGGIAYFLGSGKFFKGIAIIFSIILGTGFLLSLFL